MGRLSLRNRLASWLHDGTTDPERRALNSGNLWPSFGAFAAGRALPQLSPWAAFSLPPVSAAVQVLAQEIATLPLKIFSEDDTGQRTEAKRHPAYSLLRWQPNDLMTAARWRETAMVHVCLWGNSFSEIIFDSVGRPRAIWLIEPRQIQMFTNDTSRELLYTFNPDDGDMRVLLPSQLLHIRWLTSGTGLWGESPVMRCSDAIGLTEAAASFAARFYQGGAHLSGVLSHPTSLSETAFTALKDSWKESHEGQRKAHSVAILEEGMTWTPTSVSPEDGQMLPTREFQIAEVARVFGIPAYRIGGATDTNTYANVESENRNFWANSMRPLLTNWEQEIDSKLLSRNFFSDFDLAQVLRPDTKARFEAHAIALSSGWMLPNEVRRLEGLREIAGLDEPDPIPAPLVAVDDDDQDVDELRMIEPVLIAAIERVLTRQRRAVEGSENGKVERFFEGQPAVWLEALTPVFESAQLVGIDVPDDHAGMLGNRFAELHAREFGECRDVTLLWSAADLTEEVIHGLR